MYEIALTFWAAFGGFCLTIAVIGGVADAYLRAAQRSIRTSATSARIEVARLEANLKSQPTAEAA